MEDIMKIFILLLLIIITSCNTVQFTEWDDLSNKDKKITVVTGIIGVTYIAGMTYWIMNPSDIPENWPYNQ